MRALLFLGILLAISSTHLAFERDTLKRLAFWAASASLGLSLIASAVAARLFSSQMSAATPLWMTIPVIVGVAGMWSVMRAAAGPLWACAAAMFGFALLGAWSIGFAYVPAAWAMLIAAIVRPATTQSFATGRAIRALLFATAGASSLGVFGLLMDWWNTSVVDRGWQTPTGLGYVHETHIVSHAPIVVWTSWVFAAVSAVLVVDACVSHWRRRPGSGPS